MESSDATVLDDVGKSRPEVTFQFTVQEFSDLKKFVRSPVYFVRNIPWNIRIIPQNKGNSVGVFVECNRESKCTEWSCFANTEFKILPKRPNIDLISRRCEKMFTGSKNQDWGFPEIMNTRYVLDYDNGYIEENAITIEAHIEANVPFGIVWNSKLYTGYVGLLKSDDVSWMNCVLLLVFFTAKLRRALYRIQTWFDDPMTSLPLALQRIFHDLQFCQQAVDAKSLISLKCLKLEILGKHDYQEFMELLLGELEIIMKGTCVEEVIPNLFKGKMTSYISCESQDCSVNISEPFYKLRLDVKNMDNITEAFEKYVSTHTETGNNEYLTKEYKLQNANIHVVFSTLPPILHIYLKRFEYDSSTKTYSKNNNTFEFYETIAFDAYLQQPDPNNPADYTLQAVLVHQGDPVEGKYAAFIDPKGDGQWHEFADDIVGKCTKTQAIENNYGRGNNTACMLVYIRDSELSDILEDQTSDCEQQTLPGTKKDKLVKDNEFIRRQNQDLISMNVMLEKSRKLLIEEAEANKLECALQRQQISDLKSEIDNLVTGNKE